MALKALYETIEEIPEAHRELYTERDGKFELTGIEGIKTAADVDRLNKALVAERGEHKKTKDRVKGFGEFTPEQIEGMTTQIEELTASLEAGGKPNQEQIDKLLEAKLPAHLKPLQRDLKAASDERDALRAENLQLKGDKIARGMSDLVDITLGTKKGAIVDLRAAADVKLWAERVMTMNDEGKFVTKEGIGLTPGLDFLEALLEVQAVGSRPLWFRDNTPGGARGDTRAQVSTGENPFEAASFNLSKASALIEKNVGEAKRLARAAKNQSRVKAVFPQLLAS